MKLQDKLNKMYADREEKGYKSDYLISDMKDLEIRISKIEKELLKEEYDKDFTYSILKDVRATLEDDIQLEKELFSKLERVRANIRKNKLKQANLESILKEQEGANYISEMDYKSLVDSFDHKNFDVDLFCKTYELDLTDKVKHKPSFVMTMFSFLKSSEAFEGYLENDLMIIFYREIMEDGKRLSFSEIKQRYYANDDKSDTSFAKLHKKIKDKLKKYIKVHKDSLPF